MAELPDQKRFRWRIIPGWFFLWFGWSLIAFGSLLLVVRIVLLIFDLETTSGLTFLGISLEIIAGVFWFRAGRAFFDGRWKVAMLNLLLGYVADTSGNFLANDELIRNIHLTSSLH